MEQSSRLQVKPSIPIENKVSSPALNIKNLLLQFVRFGITGGCNATIDILALNFFLWRFPTHASDTILVYNTAAYMLGATNSYLLNKYWTFRRGKTITGDELFRFITINVIGILSNDCIFWVAIKILHPSLANLLFLTNVAKVIAVIGTAFISYAGMHFWVFKGASHGRRRKQERLAMAAMNIQRQESLDHAHKESESLALIESDATT
jgi:putative flippase GtrA